MIRFMVSLAVCVLGIVLAILTGYPGAGPAFLDLASFILAGLVPFLFASALFGFKETGAAFSTPFKKEAEEDRLKRSLAFFKTYGKAAWLMGLISALTGVISILANLEDTAALGPNTALALLPLLYCGIINLVIILPFTTFIKKRLNGKQRNGDNC